jgi:hypothetical protein
MTDMADTADAPADLPEAATRRLSDSAFTSGLTVPDFAACLQMGLEPVGFVQGFCVMQWNWYGMSSPYRQAYGPYNQGGGQGYSENYQCPHGMISAEHRSWGQNFEQTWVEQAWGQGFSTAYTRMLEEAQTAGAHGVVGVIDTSSPLSDLGVLEFHVRGTAVRVADSPPPPDGRPWTTYLAGQRLAKLIEAGYAPVSVAASVSSVRVWAYCITAYLMGGAGGTWGGQQQVAEITQVAAAQMASRQIAREHVRAQLAGDSLHGAQMIVSESELGEGDQEIQCILRGNRVRRFKDFDPVPVPHPTVRLS